jgi:hypothetical protein
MVGNIVPRQTAEPIFREWLQEMDDRRLESEALTWIWLCETTKNGPWEEDKWRRECVKDECQRREKAEEPNEEFSVSSAGLPSDARLAQLTDC